MFVVAALGETVRLLPPERVRDPQRRHLSGQELTAGIIRIARAGSAYFFMDYWNADGNVAEMCGNGIRCLAKYVYDRGLTTKTEIDVDTRGGMKHVSIEVEDGLAARMTVDMGTAAFAKKALPMTGDPFDTFVGQTFDVGGRSFRATAVSMGNPHCVLFLGPAFR